MQLSVFCNILLICKDVKQNTNHLVVCNFISQTHWSTQNSRMSLILDYLRVMLGHKHTVLSTTIANMHLKYWHSCLLLMPKCWGCQWLRFRSESCIPYARDSAAWTRLRLQACLLLFDKLFQWAFCFRSYCITC